jgi:3-hydroxymyristoyl/3-hydroxydecanoyl-(acyl carrier protein) dehydratase
MTGHETSRQRGGSTPPQLGPDILAERSDHGTAEWDLCVPSDLSCFPGHFPDYPIVPGVLQLDWVMKLAAGFAGKPLRVARVEGLKFRKPLRPGYEFTLRLEIDARLEKLRFELVADQETFSLGRVILEREPGAAE